MISRGVLLDIPKIRHTEWVEPGDAIYPEDLEAAERDHRVPSPKATCCWCARDASSCAAPRAPRDSGRDARTSRLMSQVAIERKVAVLGSDAVSDVLPTTYDHRSRCRFIPARW